MRRIGNIWILVRNQATIHSLHLSNFSQNNYKGVVEKFTRCMAFILTQWLEESRDEESVLSLLI
jgi:hypothetical protein